MRELVSVCMYFYRFGTSTSLEKNCDDENGGTTSSKKGGPQPPLPPHRSPPAPFLSNPKEIKRTGKSVHFPDRTTYLRTYPNAISRKFGRRLLPAYAAGRQDNIFSTEWCFNWR